MPLLLNTRLSLRVLPAVLLLAACDSASDTEPPPPPPADEIVAGVNLTELFATPTRAEEAAVEAEWGARDDTLAGRYTFGSVATYTDDVGADFTVFEGREAGAPTPAVYGLVRQPPRPPGDQQRRPLLLILPDGDAGVTDGQVAAGELPLLTSIHDDYVFALLAYRGEALTADGTSYSSTAPALAYDGDADDALAFLYHVLDRAATLQIDAANVGVIGLGRGGGVALLTAVRRNPYRLVVDVAGPTDLFLDTFRDRVRDLLEGDSRGLFPAIENLAETIVYPLRDDALAQEDARLALLRRSPRYFFAPPPFTVVAHGGLDFTVFPDHSRALITVIDDPSGTTQAVYLEVQKADHASITREAEVISLISTQVQERLDG